MKGLVLQGGGAKGAFEAGAIKAFTGEGIFFDAAVGTSIGAINAVMYAQEEYDKIYKLWYDLEMSDLFDIEDKYYEDIIDGNGISGETFEYMRSKVKDIIKARGLDTKEALSLIKSNVDEAKLRASHIDFGLVTVEMDAGKQAGKQKRDNTFKPLRLFKSDIPEGMVAEYIMASASLPIFQSFKINGKRYLDGGFYDNLPISMLADKGYDDITAIRLGPSKAPVRKVANNNIKIAYIDPTAKPGSTMNFTNRSIRYSLELGYYDTLKHLRGYLGKRYYLEKFDEEAARKLIFGMDSGFLENCSAVLDLPEHQAPEAALSMIKAELVKLLKLDSGAGLTEVMLTILEIFATYYGVPELRVYTMNELYAAVLGSYKRKAFWRSGQKSYNFKTELSRELVVNEIFRLFTEYYQK